MSGVSRSYGQFVLLLIGVAASLLALGFEVTRRLGGAEAIIGMLCGCGVSFVAAVVGGLPQAIGSSRSPQESGSFILGSLAIRMGLTLLGALVILLGTQVSRQVFLLWVAISYLAFLLADVVFFLTRSRSR